MAKDRNGKELPKGITWLEKKKLYMGRFQYEGQSYTVYAKTLRETNRKLSDKKYEVEHGMSGKADRIRLDEWFETWLQTYKSGKVKATTISTYKALYDRFVREPLGGRYLSKIKTVEIQRLYNVITEDGLSPKYLKTLHNTLSNVFKMAVNNDLISKTPCTQTIRPAIDISERHVLTASEQKRLLSFMCKEQYKNVEPAITVLLGTGLRIGELLGLKWEDLDLESEEKTLTVKRTLVRIRDQKIFAFQEPKTASGARTVPLQGYVIKALKRQKVNQGYYKLSGKWNPPTGFEGLVFPGRKGQPQWRSCIAESLDKIIAAMNEEEKENAAKEDRKPIIMEHINLHACRHSFATRCLEAGIAPKIVQTWLVQHCRNNGEYSTRYFRHRRVVVSQRCTGIASFLRLALTKIACTVFTVISAPLY